MVSDINILANTYFDECTVIRKIKNKNPNTGVTETVEVVIADGVKCALSKQDEQIMSIDGIGKLNFSHKLFTSPNIDILEADILIVKHMGIVDKYVASKPFKYSSHAEIMLTCKGIV